MAEFYWQGNLVKNFYFNGQEVKEGYFNNGLFFKSGPSIKWIVTYTYEGQSEPIQETFTNEDDLIDAIDYIKYDCYDLVISIEETEGEE